jgi:hypothetical protein
MPVYRLPRLHRLLLKYALPAETITIDVSTNSTNTNTNSSSDGEENEEEDDNSYTTVLVENMVIQQGRDNRYRFVVPKPKLIRKWVDKRDCKASPVILGGVNRPQPSKHNINIRPIARLNCDPNLNQ